MSFSTVYACTYNVNVYGSLRFPPPSHWEPWKSSNGSKSQGLRIFPLTTYYGNSNLETSWKFLHITWDTMWTVRPKSVKSPFKTNLHCTKLNLTQECLMGAKFRISFNQTTWNEMTHQKQKGLHLQWPTQLLCLLPYLRHPKAKKKT